MVRFAYRSFVGFSMMACLILSPHAASADAIRFLDVGPEASVTIGGSIGSNYHGAVRAGEMEWAWVGTPPAGFAQQFYTYCVDLAHFVQPVQIEEADLSTGFTNGVANGGSKAAWLFNQYAAGIHALGNTAAAAVNAAALQIAIWEAMYDSSASLGTGGFTASASVSIITRADGYLTALYQSNMTAVATILNSNGPYGGQDQIVARVSEPSTLLLLGLAFFSFATLARRRITSAS